MIISTGRSRTDKRWRNVTTTWPELVEKLSTPHRTHETMREYKAMSKDEQSRVKDVGGFVGGRIEGARRSAGSIKERWLITLDADNAAVEPDELFDDFTVIYGLTTICYSTHSHTPEKPRLRFVLPLDRAVTPEEYGAIARRIALCIGIEAMDLTTYQPERLMYWPSCPSDGEYFYRCFEGDTVKADEVLALYGEDDAWKDTRLWPIAKGESEIRTREILKAGEPTGKPGIVGLFCRTYDVPSAIDAFLSDIYEECDDGARYTYIKGSTSAGAVLYNGGAFLYSNHSTDPAGGQLCNAFDLVRIHKFGALDAGQEAQEITRRPSYLKMCDFAAGLKEVKVQRAEELSAEADAQFGDIAEIVKEDDNDNGDSLNSNTFSSHSSTLISCTERLSAKAENPDSGNSDWATQLSINHKTGECDPAIHNAVLIMENDPRLKGVFALNEFSGQPVLRKAPPWGRGPIKDPLNGDLWSDADDAELSHYMEVAWKFKSDKAILKAWEIVTEHHNKFHPVREYLDSLTWDGTERLDTVLIKWLGAEDSQYVRAVTRKWLTAGVARMYNPGCKFDGMLVLIGPQGQGKSRFGRIMSKGWFTDSAIHIGDKEGYSAIHGSWIVEMGELASTRKKDIEDVKGFISATGDTFRPAYGKHNITLFRQNIFFGTTNDAEFLRDRTGNRRFWPVTIKGVDRGVLKGLEESVDQIWAEAKDAWRKGESLWLDDPELAEIAVEEQENFIAQDGLAGQIEDYLDKPLPENWDDYTPQMRRDFFSDGVPVDKETCTTRRDRICGVEVINELMGIDVSKLGQNDMLFRRVVNILNTMPGWRRESKRSRGKPYGLQRRYARMVVSKRNWTQEMNNLAS